MAFDVLNHRLFKTAAVLLAIGGLFTAAVPDVSAVLLALTLKDVTDAAASLNDAQPLHAETHAVHGAGFFVPQRRAPVVQRHQQATVRAVVDGQK